MKRSTVFYSTILIILAGLTIAGANSPKYVEITKPFASVYERLDPRSNIIVQAQMKDHFELNFEGTSWYNVKVNDKHGWVEKSAGKVVDNPGATFFSIPLSTLFFFLLLLFATIFGASFLIYRQKTVEL
ncbi:MAG: hypothetical protein PVI26_00645 [Chitinispirillia bacterium]|jgi:hypothetical protein